MMRILASRRELFLTLAALIVAAMAISYLVTGMLKAEQRAGSGQALIGGPFTLIDHRGNEVTEASFAGRYMLIYFGYAFCPDVCPLSLQTMTAAYDLLSPEEQAQVQPIFITVDPERDTIDAMREYVPLFHEDLVGLTGTVEQSKTAARAYRVYSAKATTDRGAADYLVDHSSFYYLMGPDGRYIRHFGHATTEEDMATGIQDLL